MDLVWWRHRHEVLVDVENTLRKCNLSGIFSQAPSAWRLPAANMKLHTWGHSLWLPVWAEEQALCVDRYDWWERTGYTVGRGREECTPAERVKNKLLSSTCGRLLKRDQRTEYSKDSTLWEELNFCSQQVSTGSLPPWELLPCRCAVCEVNRGFILRKEHFSILAKSCYF